MAETWPTCWDDSKHPGVRGQQVAEHRGLKLISEDQ